MPRPRKPQKPPPQTYLALRDKRCREGKPLSANAVRDDDSPLHASASNYFGSWAKALTAAGLDPREHHGEHGRRKWTDQDILDAIQRRRRGDSLNPQAVAEDDKPLLSVARKRFAGWAGALAAAGIDSHAVYAHRRWDRDRIVRQMRRRWEEFKTLSSKAASKHDSGLWNAAIKEFGSWAEAVRAVGLSPVEEGTAGASICN